jgi:mxaK protein
MVLITRQRTRAVLVVLVLVAIAALVDAAMLWRTQRLNESIASGQLPAEAAGQAPELRFAQAYRQTQVSASAAAASAAREGALNRYRALQGDARVGALARYNSANLLLRQAIEIRAGAQPGQAIALIELAKEYYRDVLRDDPGQWDARYNLERAQRLLPDPDDVDAEPPEQAQNRERAATTMRGFSPGLP